MEIQTQNMEHELLEIIKTYGIDSMAEGLSEIIKKYVYQYLSSDTPEERFIIALKNHHFEISDYYRKLIPKYILKMVDGDILVSLYCKAIEKGDTILMNHIDDKYYIQTSCKYGYFSIAALRIGDIEMFKMYYNKEVDDEDEFSRHLKVLAYSEVINTKDLKLLESFVDIVWDKHTMISFIVRPYNNITLDNIDGIINLLLFKQLIIYKDILNHNNVCSKKIIEMAAIHAHTTDNQIKFYFSHKSTLLKYRDNMKLFLIPSWYKYSGESVVVSQKVIDTVLNSYVGKSIVLSDSFTKLRIMDLETYNSLKNNFIYNKVHFEDNITPINTKEHNVPEDELILDSLIINVYRNSTIS